MYNFNTTIEELTFVVADIETSGLPEWDRTIIEIGAVTIEPPMTLNPHNIFECFVNPKGPITCETTAIHGITDSMVSRAATIEEVIKNFTDYAEGKILVFHNAPFDYTIISRIWSMLKMRPNVHVLDTLKLSRKINRNLSHHSLDDIIRHYNIQPLRENMGAYRHRALYDADMTAIALLHMLNYLDNKGIFTFGDLFNFHG